jgi:hypothetical protein
MRPNAKTTRKNAKRSPGAAARQNEGTIARAFRGARSEIRAHAKAVRAANEQAHVERTDACAKAADGVVLPASEVIAAATEDKRPVVKGKKVKTLRLTSRAKMGAARRTRKKAEPKVDTLAALKASVADLDATPVAEAKAELAVATEAAEKIALDWSSFPATIDREGAETIARMLIEGWFTPRQLIEATGMANVKDRIQVDKLGERNGYKLKGRVNPDRDHADKETAKLWHWVRADA